MTRLVVIEHDRAREEVRKAAAALIEEHGHEADEQRRDRQHEPGEANDRSPESRTRRWVEADAEAVEGVLIRKFCFNVSAGRLPVPKIRPQIVGTLAPGAESSHPGLFKPFPATLLGVGDG